MTVNAPIDSIIESGGVEHVSSWRYDIVALIKDLFGWRGGISDLN